MTVLHLDPIRGKYRKIYQPLYAVASTYAHTAINHDEDMLKSPGSGYRLGI